MLVKVEVIAYLYKLSERQVEVFVIYKHPQDSTTFSFTHWVKTKLGKNP